MLKILSVNSPDEKKTHFLANQSLEDLWIVSHIEAKKWIHEQFLLSSESIPTQSVLRASEFWQWLFSINCPEQRVISESLIYAFIEEWFAQENVETQLNDIEMFFNFFTQSAPLLYLDPQQLFEDWLKMEPQRRERLWPWWEKAKKFRDVLDDKKWVGRPWLLNKLLQKNELYLGDHQTIYFDLGWDLQHEEVDLILRLSKTKDVVVFQPQLVGEKESSAVYQRLTQAGKCEEASVTEKKPAALSFLHEPSVLLEVKSCVVKIRELLMKGVRLHDIAVVSPALEDYWPLLRTHFFVEGIPLNKRVVLRVISLPSVQLGLARLHLLQEDFQQSHLSAVVYMQEAEQRKVSYADFKKNYSYVYDTAPLRRAFDLPPAISAQHVFTLAEFVELIAVQWPPEEHEILEEITDRLVKDLNLHDEMTFVVWLKYLELVISQFELSVQAEVAQGVQFLSLNAADWNQFTHMFVLGCEQNLLVKTQRTPLKMEDLFAIERDLGFSLSQTESHKAELDLSWILQRDLKNIYLSHAETNFQGDPQLAAHLWLQKRNTNSDEQTGEYNDPSTTRWDQLMNQPLASLVADRGASAEEQNLIEQKMAREAETIPFAPVLIEKKPRLSASQLQKFDHCAFQFFAEKILRLQVTPEYDLDIDPMYSGQILHGVLEKLLLDYPGLTASPQDVEAIYDRIVAEMAQKNPLQEFWGHEKRRHLQMIMNFIELEKDYRRTHPGVKVAGTEVVVKGFISTDENILSRTNENGFPFLGKIDRLDVDERGHYAILDYKTSQGSLKTFGSWLDNSQFQMSLYAWAIEAGLGEGIPAEEVSSAEYIFLKEKKRGAGFIVDEENSGFIGLEKPGKLLSVDKKQEHLEQLQIKIHAMLNKIEKGEFAPVPKELKICETCDWSQLCRAPHLR